MGARTLLGGAKSAARVGSELSYELAGRLGLREPVGLTGPEVEAVGVPRLACVGAQRRGDVVHVGIAERRVRVLLHEPVGDAAPRAAGERARERGRGVGL